MRKETIEKEIYTFNELSSEAKEIVKKWYLDGQDSSIFSDMTNEDLSYLFKNSELKIDDSWYKAKEKILKGAENE